MINIFTHDFRVFFCTRSPAVPVCTTSCRRRRSPCREKREGSKTRSHLHFNQPHTFTSCYPRVLAINTPHNKLHEPEMISDKAECHTLKSGEMFNHAIERPLNVPEDRTDKYSTESSSKWWHELLIIKYLQRCLSTWISKLSRQLQ